MFRELAPLLRQRAVLLTLTHLEEDQIRVNVIPRQLAAGENAALTVPISLTGTAAELDEQLPHAIVDFVAKHLEVKNTLESAKAEMDAAAKAAKEEAKNKTKTVTKRPEPVQSKPEPKAEPATPASRPGLFDTLSTGTSAEQLTNGPTDEDEIMKEINERERDSDEPEHIEQDDIEDHAAAA